MNGIAKPVGLLNFKKGAKIEMSSEERQKAAAEMRSIEIKTPETIELPSEESEIKRDTQQAAVENSPSKPKKLKSSSKIDRQEKSDVEMRVAHWRIPKDDYDALQAIADAQYGTMNKLVRGIIKEWLENREKE